MFKHVILELKIIFYSTHEMLMHFSRVHCTLKEFNFNIISKKIILSDI